MTSCIEGKVVFFATNNVHKFNEARDVLREFKLTVGMVRVKSLEIQSDSLEEIACISVIDAFRKCHLPLIVEDAGLFVEELNGFPGPYSAYVYKTIGNEGLLRIMKDVANQNARFESAIAFLSKKLKQPMCFKGEVAGAIAGQERRSERDSSFGFDPVFKPTGSDKTFGEMSIDEKDVFSHRAKALRKFGQWYRKLL